MANRRAVSAIFSADGGSTATIAFTGPQQPIAGDKVVVYVWNGWSSDPNFTGGSDNCSVPNPVNYVDRENVWGTAPTDHSGYWLYQFYVDIPVGASWTGNYQVTVNFDVVDDRWTGIAVAYDGLLPGDPSSYSKNNSANGRTATPSTDSVIGTGTGLYSAAFTTDAGGAITISATGGGFTTRASVLNGGTRETGAVADIAEGSGTQAASWTLAATHAWAAMAAFWPDSSSGGSSRDAHGRFGVAQARDTHGRFALATGHYRDAHGRFHLRSNAYIESYQREVAADHPIGHWVQGDSPITVVDKTGNGRNGIPSSTVDREVPIVTDRKPAWTFDGSDAYIDIPDIPGSPTFTIEVLFRVPSVLSSYQEIVTTNIGAAGSNTAALWIGDISVNGALAWNDGFNTVIDAQWSVRNFCDNIWHHAAVTYDGTTARLYVDAAQVGVTTGYFRPLDGGTLRLGGQSLVMFSGGIKDPAVYNYALSEDRIATHAKKQIVDAYGTAYGLFAHWRFDEPPPLPFDQAPVYDTSGLAINNALYVQEGGTLTLGLPGVSGDGDTCYGQDGGQFSYVQNNNLPFSLNFGADITYKIWFKTSQTSAQGIFGHDDGDPTNGGSIPAIFLNNNGTLCTHFWWFAAGLPVQNVLYAGSGLYDGKWHCCHVTWDNSTGVLALYVDGVLGGTAVCTLNTYDPSRYYTGLVYVGTGSPDAGDFTGTGWFMFNGELDEQSMWAYPMSTAEVAADFIQDLHAKDASGRFGHASDITYRFAQGHAGVSAQGYRNAAGRFRLAGRGWESTPGRLATVHSPYAEAIINPVKPRGYYRLNDPTGRGYAQDSSGNNWGGSVNGPYITRGVVGATGDGDTATTIGSINNYRNAILPDSPVLWWRLNELSGTTVADSSGNGHSGTIAGGVSLAQDGRTGDGDGCAYFGGVDGRISTSLPALGNAYSQEIWIWNNVTKFADIAADETDNITLWQEVDGTLHWSADTATTPFDITTAMPTDSVWHHVVGTFDGATACLYLDGTLVASAAATTAPSGAATYSIGLYNGGAYSGYLDEFAVYNYALTAAQVAAHHAAVAPSWIDTYPASINADNNNYETTILDDSPMAYWRLDDSIGTGGTVTDYSGNSHSGTALGTWIGSGYTGAIADGDHCFYFDGPSTSRVEADGLPDTSTSWTVECWFAGQTSTDYSCLIDTPNDSNLTLDPNTGLLRFWQSSTGLSVWDAQNRNLGNWDWHHCVAVGDGTLLSLYIDGVLAGTATIPPSSLGAGTYTIGSTTSRGLYTTGYMDDVAIYDHALTAEEVARHYRDAKATYTVECWFKIPDVTNVSQIIVNGGGGFLIVYGSNSWSWGGTGWLQWNDGFRSLNVIGTPPDGYMDGQWHHVAVSLNKTEAHLYVDGRLRDSVIGNWQVIANTTIRFGGNFSGPPIDNFVGIIDEVAIYDTALPFDGGIYSHYQARLFGPGWAGFPSAQGRFGQGAGGVDVPGRAGVTLPQPGSRDALGRFGVSLPGWRSAPGRFLGAQQGYRNASGRLRTRQPYVDAHGRFSTAPRPWRDARGRLVVAQTEYGDGPGRFGLTLNSRDARGRFLTYVPPPPIVVPTAPGFQWRPRPPGAGPYTFYITDLQTGNILCELPFQNFKYSTRINKPGTWSGDLMLSDPSTIDLNEALQLARPEKSGIFVDRKGEIMYSGIIWGRTSPQDIGDSKISLTGSDFTSYLYRRVIDNSFGYTSTEQLTIFADLVDFAQGYAINTPGGNVAAQDDCNVGIELDGDVVTSYVFDQNTGLINRIRTVNPSGVNRQRTYNWFDFKVVGTMIEELSRVLDGFEWQSRGKWDGNRLVPTIYVKYSEFGTQRAGTTDLVWIYGSDAVIQWPWTEDSSGTAHTAYAIGSGTDAAKLFARSPATGTSEFPRLDKTIQFGSDSDQASLQGHADDALQVWDRKVVPPAIVVRGNLEPDLAYYQDGDVGRFIVPRAMTYRFPYGLDEEWRIMGKDVTVNDDATENVALVLDVQDYIDIAYDDVGNAINLTQQGSSGV